MTPCYLKPATSSLLVRSCVVLSWAMLSPGCTVYDTTPPQAKPVSGTGGESQAFGAFSAGPDNPLARKLR